MSHTDAVEVGPAEFFGEAGGPIDQLIAEQRKAWIDVSFPEVVSDNFGKTRFVITGEGQGMWLAVHPGNADADFKASTPYLVNNLAHQQGLTPARYIGSIIAQRHIRPELPMVVLPNNSAVEPTMVFNDRQKARIAEGDYRPIMEIRMEALERVVGSSAIYSLGVSKGGNDALRLPKEGSTRFTIAGIAAVDPASNTGRSGKELIRDFGQSGGWTDQRKAIAQANIPALSQSMNAARLARDYALFGGYQLISKTSKVALQSMAGSINGLTQAALDHVGDGKVAFGFVDGSLIFDKESLSLDVITRLATLEKYGGRGFNKHASFDDPFVQAIMFARLLKAVGLETQV